MGAVTFGSIVFSFWKNTRKIARIRRAYGDEATGFPFQVASAVGTGVVLLLFMGNFGHNLFRFTWLWYGGFLIVAAHCIKNWVQTAEYDAMLEDESDELE